MDDEYYEKLAQLYEAIRDACASLEPYIGSEEAAARIRKQLMRTVSNELLPVRHVTTEASRHCWLADPALAPLRGNIAKAEGAELMFEHPVVARMIHDRLSEDLPHEQRVGILKKHAFIVVCTCNENDNLPKNMPANWSFEDGESMARYAGIGYQAVPTGPPAVP